MPWSSLVIASGMNVSFAGKSSERVEYTTKATENCEHEE